MRRLLSFLAALLLIAMPAQAQEKEQAGIFANRPAFSAPETPAKASASCEQLRAMAEGVPSDQNDRIDLSVTGTLTLVKSDGALWYLVVCSDLRVMCVTYQDNGMKVGNMVEMRGAYRRLDTNHAVLDPCLASYP